MNLGFRLGRGPRSWILAPGLLLAGSVSILAGPPKWVLELASRPAPEVASDTPAVILLNETVVAVDADGRASTTNRQAIRILTRAGIAEAKATVPYLEKKDSVGDCDAWLIRGGQAVKIPREREWIDVAESGGGSIYSEFRARFINYADQALPGDVFVYEARVEGPMLFCQLRHVWGGPLPSLVDRYQLQIPAGWASSTNLEGPVTPLSSVSADGRMAVWELRNRPYRPDEPWAPARDWAEAYLMVALTPAPRAKTKAPRGFGSWAEVVDWTDRLNSEQCDADPALAATVRKLVADCPDNLAKIRALGRYVQDLRYVEVARDVGIGFGYRARKATEVHAKGWGDCKDKANLLRAMLRQAGLRAYPTVAEADRQVEVFPEWPSPMQFNHMIVAIEVDESVVLPAVVPTPRWGRLLIFDPTDPNTVVGDLRRDLQGSKVLICADGGEELTTLPTLSVEPEYLFEQRVELSLSANGSVSGKCSLGGAGQVGAERRRWLRMTSANELREKAVERLSATVRGVAVTNVTSNDDRRSGRCSVVFEFSAPNFAQLMGGGLALVRLDVLSRDSVPTFAGKERRTPIEIRPVSQHDEVVLELPAGFKAEELPPKAVLAGPYGSYENSFEVSGQSVLRHRALKLTPAIVPVSEYANLKKFLSDVAKADRTAVVLQRTP